MLENIATISKGMTNIMIGSNISLFSIMGAKIPQQRAPNPVNTTRSGRCMKPTLHSSPNPSARART